MTQNSINNSASSFKIDNITLDGNTISSTDTNGNIILAPDGSGTVSVTTAPIVPSGDRADSLGSATNSWDNVYADGVSFDDGTNVLSTFVDTATWTPVIQGTGAVGAGTYTTQTGYYTRIGNMVYVGFHLVWSAHTGTGDMRLGGLPIAANGTATREKGNVQWSNATTISGSRQWGFLTCIPGTQFVFQFTNTSGSVQTIAMDTAAGVKGSLWYFA